MIFGWLKRRRRRKILARPFPERWRGYLQSNVRHYACLSAAQQQKLEKCVLVFVAEKHWAGGGGLQISDEIKVTVAAEACLLVLGVDDYYFDGVQTIVVHPGAFVPPASMQSEQYMVVDESLPTLGEAWHRGPIVLSWQHVVSGGRGSRDGENVVLHEFAHHLDGLDGSMDGAPPIASRERRQTWYDVTEAEFERLAGSARRGEATLLDHYGASNKAEFFAVATECFFERPRAMLRRHQRLYRVLQDFYRQDPAQWVAD